MKEKEKGNERKSERWSIRYESIDGQTGHGLECLSFHSFASTTIWLFIGRILLFLFLFLFLSRFLSAHPTFSRQVFTSHLHRTTLGTFCTWPFRLGLETETEWAFRLFLISRATFVSLFVDFLLDFPSFDLCEMSFYCRWWSFHSEQRFIQSILLQAHLPICPWLQVDSFLPPTRGFFDQSWLCTPVSF